GRVCFGLAQHGQKTRTETIEFGALGRAEVRAAARDHALTLLLDALA
ncbi:MAG: CinA family protein, partial [Gemmobacter sp.]|nr:CinA family protein [Gemmobacter sp.]